MGVCSRCSGEKPEGRIHSWCAVCLREYKEQRYGTSAMSQAALDALECYQFSEDGEQQPSTRTADEGELQKQCLGCGTFKPLTQFSQHLQRRDGRRARCKLCLQPYDREYSAKRKREVREAEEEDEEELQTRHLYGHWDGTGPPPSPGHGDLYVMQNSRIAGELKIGRSQDVEAHRRSLQASQNLKMLVLAVFPGAGHIETSVHNILNYCRVTEEAAGREWFACSPQTAFAAIGKALGAATSAASSA